MHRKIGKDRACGSGDMITHRRAYHNTLPWWYKKNVGVCVSWCLYSCPCDGDNVAAVRHWPVCTRQSLLAGWPLLVRCSCVFLLSVTAVFHWQTTSCLNSAGVIRGTSVFSVSVIVLFTIHIISFTDAVCNVVNLHQNTCLSMQCFQYRTDSSLDLTCYYSVVRLWRFVGDFTS